MVQVEIENSQNYEQLVKQLNIVKTDGIMRCEGRLQYSGLPFESINPALLPRDHCYTDLVVMEAHEMKFHGGVNTTLAEIRRRYWVPKGRQVITEVLRVCKDCARRCSKILNDQTAS